MFAAFFAALVATAQPATQPAAANVEVVRDGDHWTAEFRFARAAPVWVFTDSIAAREAPGDWRAGSWTVTTPGVRLQRHGWYDALVPDKGSVPDRVTIRFTPFTRDIEASYDAALAFTDGSVALYDGKFQVFPAQSVAQVKGMPLDPGEVSAAGVQTIVRMRDRAGPVLARGLRAKTAESGGAGTYVIFGKIEPVRHEAITTVIDPALPAWLASAVTSDVPAVLAGYASQLGPVPGGAPNLLRAGPTPQMRSMGGSVLESMIVMTFEGDALNVPNRDVRNAARWFAAHEGAHFWLGQAVHYEGPRDSWITEGGADLLAYRAVAAVDPAFDVRAALQEALEACIASATKGPIASANERGDHKAYYNCGAIFGLVAERASGGDFAGFVRALIESNKDDKQISRAEWLAALDERAAGKGLGTKIGQLLDHRSGNAGPWAALLSRAGIPHGVSGNGVPRLQ
jgi:hypothetical protein